MRVKLVTGVKRAHFTCLTVSLASPASFVYNHMVMKEAALNATFAALADPTRRAILARLASGEATVNELAEPFDMSQPAISKHLKVLERAGLIVSGQDAQRRPRKLEPKPLAGAIEWIETYRQYWEAAFERLDEVLEELKVERKSDRKDRKRKKR
jgi:DNA-binding transcriptional ArsR family regulator